MYARAYEAFGQIASSTQPSTLPLRLTFFGAGYGSKLALAALVPTLAPLALAVGVGAAGAAATRAGKSLWRKAKWARAIAAYQQQAAVDVDVFFDVETRRALELVEDDASVRAESLKKLSGRADGATPAQCARTAKALLTPSMHADEAKWEWRRLNGSAFFATALCDSTPMKRPLALHWILLWAGHMFGSRTASGWPLLGKLGHSDLVLLQGSLSVLVAIPATAPEAVKLALPSVRLDKLRVTFSWGSGADAPGAPERSTQVFESDLDSFAATAALARVAACYPSHHEWLKAVRARLLLGAERPITRFCMHVDHLFDPAPAPGPAAGPDTGADAAPAPDTSANPPSTPVRSGYPNTLLARGKL